MDDSFALRAGEARALVSAQGAECRQWRIGARDMLWAGGGTIWPSVAPVLFPACGWSRNGQIRIGEKTYPMPVHGFASHGRFDAKPIDDSAICFTLRSDETTAHHYPFNFTLALTYRLAPTALNVSFEVINDGDCVMPYAVGLHPGFVLDWKPGPHCFTFAQDQRPEVPVIAPGGLFSQARRAVPLQGRRLDLTPELFCAEALCFLDLAKRRFALEGPEGRLSIDAPDFPHLVLWNRQGAPFLAIESWTGTGDPEDFSGDFFARPSMIQLPPGQRRTHHVRYCWEPLGRAQAKA